MISGKTTKKKVSHAIIALIALHFFALIPASAQFADPLQRPNDIANQMQNVYQAPTPPPPGSPGGPLPVIPGDTGAIIAPPTSQADGTAGTNSPVGVGQSDSVVRIFVDNTDKGTGLRMVQTLRPSSLTAEQLGKVQGALGVSLTSGEPVIDVTATKATMEQVNQALNPYPTTDNAGGRKKINSDQPAAGYPKQTPNYDFQGPLPTVRTFSKYLVILGVVASTIFMALAATSVVMGHPYAGSRVVGAAAGLMLLLMGYTIWKIVQMNTFNANDQDQQADNNQKSDQGNVSDAYLQAPNVPQQPALPGGVNRGGIPVAPLRGSN